MHAFKCCIFKRLWVETAQRMCVRRVVQRRVVPTVDPHSPLVQRLYLIFSAVVSGSGIYPWQQMFIPAPLHCHLHHRRHPLLRCPLTRSVIGWQTLLFSKKIKIKLVLVYAPAIYHCHNKNMHKTFDLPVMHTSKICK